MILAWIFVCAFGVVYGCYQEHPSPMKKPRRSYYLGDTDAGNIISDLLLPLLAKGHESHGKRDIHNPDFNAKDLNLDLQRHKPSDYIPNNLDISHNSDDPTVFVRHDRNKNVKDLNENLMDLLKDIYGPKDKISESAVCDRFLRQIGLRSNDIKFEIALHYCREILYSLFNKEHANDVSHETSSGENSHDLKSKSHDDGKNAFKCCAKYVCANYEALIRQVSSNLDKIRPPVNLPHVKPWFGPYGGKSDLDPKDKYPEMSSAYLNNYKKKI